MRTNGWYRIGLAILLAGTGLVVLFGAMGRPARAEVQTLSWTTLADFSAGEFLRTGLADLGDGAVSLLRVGLSGDWITTVVTTGLTPRWGHTAVFTSGRLFVIGGQNCTGCGHLITATIVQSAAVQSDRSLSPWVTATTNLTALFPSGLSYGGAAVVNDFLYVIGGRREPLPGATPQATVAFARIGADGSLSPFTATAPLPEGRESFGLAAWNGWLYVVGGLDATGSPTQTILVARPDPTTGQIAGWTVLSRTLPEPLYGHAVVAEQGYLYVIGGITMTGGSPTFEVWFAPLGEGTLRAPFARTTALDNNLFELAVIGYGGMLLTSGGLQNNLAEPSADVRAGVTADSGEVLTWTATSVITPPRHAHAMVVLPDGWVYVIGGRYWRPGMSEETPLTHINAGRLSAEGSGRFLSDGRYLAPPFRLDRRRQLQALEAHVLRPAGTDIALRFRLQAQEGLPWSDWGNWILITETGEVTAVVPLAAYAQGLQVEVALSTTNPLTAPALLNLNVRYEVPDQPPRRAKQADPLPGTPRAPGDPITYTLVVTNDSGAVLHGVRWIETFPPGVAFRPGSATASPGVVLTATESGLLAEVGTLEQGAVVTVTFAVTVTATSGTVENVGVLQTDEFGTLPTERVAHPVASLLLSIGSSPSSGSEVVPGDRLTVTVRVTNPAPTAWSNLVLSATLPEAVALLPDAIQASTGTVATQGSSLQWTVPVLGANAALTFTGRVTDAPFIADGTWLTTGLTLTLSGSPLSTTALAHLVRQPYAIEVFKTDGAEWADAGQVVRYTLTLTNTGWVTVSGLQVTDILSGWPWIAGIETPGWTLVSPTQWVRVLPSLGPRMTTVLTLAAQIRTTANVSDVQGPFQNTVLITPTGTTGRPLAPDFRGMDQTRLAGPDLVGTILPGSIDGDGRNVTFTVVLTNIGLGTARTISPTANCGHWVLIGFLADGVPVKTDYLNLPFPYFLSPGASVRQTFSLPLSRPASVRAVVDLPMPPQFGLEGRGCIIETDEDNNTTPAVWMSPSGEPFRLFLPLILRGP